MVTIFDNFNAYILASLLGLFSGIGGAIGQYFANKHIIKKTRKLFRKLKQQKK